MNRRVMAALLLTMLTIACDRQETPAGERTGATGAPALSGTVKVDGSSTVFPITEAVAEEFQKENRDVKVTVGISGTGGGFKKFCSGEIDISDASRPIKPTEVELCGKNGIAYIELPVAYDGLAVMVNPRNTWATSMTVDELKKMWAPQAQGKLTKWSDIRPGWPQQEFHLYGAGVDSGTYDYFTEAIVGEEHASRGDYTSSEDDNIIVQGIANDPNALGFFGYAYYAENKDKLKLVAIEDGKADNGAGPILPSPQTVQDGTYQPLSRPVFIYISTRSLERPEVSGFVDFYIRNAPELVTEVGYIALPPRAYQLASKKVADRTTGSVFGGKGSQIGVSIETLLAGSAEEKK